MKSEESTSRRWRVQTPVAKAEREMCGGERLGEGWPDPERRIKGSEAVGTTRPGPETAATALHDGDIVHGCGDGYSEINK